jgi:molybdate transport system substrate-binding protein
MKPHRCRALALAAVLALCAAAASARPVVVFAAASLRNALDEVIAGWPGGTATVAYAGSPALARQIEQGAPADLFISADGPWMDHLAGQGLLREGTRRDLLGNRLVLIAHGPAAPLGAIGPGTDILGLLKGERLAMAHVAAVPAGRYGRAALEALGLWAGLAGRLAQAENVRAVLALVARGEAPLGIVYATDAAAQPGVSVIGTFPTSSHPPIVYPAAVLAGSTNPAAGALAEHLASAAARAVFDRHGFTVPD